jgi:hypothetical protein
MSFRRSDRETAGLRGQSSWNRESFELPDEREARAKYDDDTEKEAAGLRKPSLLERFKRWFSAVLRR